MQKLVMICLSVLICVSVSSANGHQEEFNNNISSEDFIEELALHDAVRAKDKRIVQELLKANSAYDSKDKYGYTPLHLAVRYDLYDVVDMLIKKGANVNNMDNFGDTPLLDSTRNSTNPISRLLLCNGAETEVEDLHQMKPLHNASKNQDLYIVKLINSSDRQTMCNTLDISLDAYYRKENKICGQILTGIVDNVKIVITDMKEAVEPLGTYDATIEDSQYCATLDFKPKKSKEYLVTATGINEIDKDVELNELKKITIKDLANNLYDDLMKEFAQDFEPWNASLQKEGLIFRFQKPEILFEKGSSEVKSNFLEILVNFFPRYMKVIEPYKDEIQELVVSGHTSSEFTSAKTDDERYEKNKMLSQSRAQEVYTYTYNQISELVQKNKNWLTEHYRHEGRGFDELIYDENGNENIEQSRRVEFTIVELKEE